MTVYINGGAGSNSCAKLKDFFSWYLLEVQMVLMASELQ